MYPELYLFLPQVLCPTLSVFCLISVMSRFTLLIAIGATPFHRAVHVASPPLFAPPYAHRGPAPSSKGNAKGREITA